MIPRATPYISWRDLFAAARYCWGRQKTAGVERSAEVLWARSSTSTPYRATVLFMSVRSGLDALLQVLAFSRGSEIVVSAITIPHVLDILRHHGLVAVPVDLDPGTLAVSAADVECAITPSTRAILIAHIFGSRMPMDAINRVAQGHDLPVLEDCAQANDGSGYHGHPGSAVAMFSFGSIKTQTALGGGLFSFKSADLAHKVRAIQDTYPRQSPREYFRRVAKMAAVKLLVHRDVYDLAVLACHLAGIDRDAALGKALRSFAANDLIVQLRKRPAFPLARLLARRLMQANVAHTVAKRVGIVRTVTDVFPELPRPGALAEQHAHWIFPMLSQNPDRLMRHLWSRGIDATRGASNITCVPAPNRRAEPHRAQRMMRDIVYLPISLSARNDEMRAMASFVRDYLRSDAKELADPRNSKERYEVTGEDRYRLLGNYGSRYKPVDR